MAEGGAGARTRSAEPLLRCHDLHAYYGESYVVQGASFEIAENEILTVLGRNGAGKTTTLRCIARAREPELRRGEIWMAGEAIHRMPTHMAARAGISLVPEDRRIIPGEVPTDCLQRVESYLRDRLGDSVSWEFFPPWVNMPPLAQEVGDPGGWVSQVRDAVGKASGKIPALGGVPYGTDAGPLGQAGLPCLVIGPGDIAQAHTKDEWIEVDQLQTAVEAYYQIAVALG